MKAKAKEALFIIWYSMGLGIVMTTIIFYSLHMGLGQYTLSETNKATLELLFDTKNLFIDTGEEHYINYQTAKKMNKQAFKGESVYEPVVCFWDSSVENHSDKTVDEAKRYYKGSYRTFDRLEMPSDIDSVKTAGLLDCDIINYSLGIDSSYNEESVAYHRDNALDLMNEWDGLFIAAAGNTQGEDTVLHQAFSLIKQTHPEFEERIIIVGQLSFEQGDLTNNAVFGEEIDVMVPNGSYLLPFNDQQFIENRGTSFAAPVVTAVSANLMSQYGKDNIPMIREKITNQPEFFTEQFNTQTYSYPILNIGNSYKP